MGLDIDRQYYALCPEGRDLCLNCPVRPCCVYDDEARAAGLTKSDCPIVKTRSNGRAAQRMVLSEVLMEAGRMIEQWGPMTIRGLGGLVGVRRETVKSWIHRGLLEARIETGYAGSGPRRRYVIYGVVAE